jgi:hypothetical protein
LDRFKIMNLHHTNTNIEQPHMIDQTLFHRVSLY